MLGLSARSSLNGTRRYTQTTTSAQVSKLWPKLLPQRVFIGSEAIPKMNHASGACKPFIITDPGLVSAGLAVNLRKAHFPSGTVAVHDEPTPTPPSLHKLFQTFLQADYDSIIGFGGGGPMDAAKCIAWLQALNEVDSVNYSASSPDRVSDLFLQFKEIMTAIDEAPEERQKAYNLKKLLMIPTTAGTGSDGGKSVVVSFHDGSKRVLGHSSLIPPYVALDPSQTISLPHRATAATAVDALAHCMEAYFVKAEDAMQKDLDLTMEDVKVCDEFSICGLNLLLENLPIALAKPDYLPARQDLQIAALFGAKAFRKGDLGAIHATAHALGSLFHSLHHGECIHRMFLPALSFNEPRVTGDMKERFEDVRLMFQKHGFKGPTLTDATASFLSALRLPKGLEGLPPPHTPTDTSSLIEGPTNEPIDFDLLALRAFKDNCNTNPVPMTVSDYKRIFQTASLAI